MTDAATLDAIEARAAHPACAWGDPCDAPVVGRCTVHERHLCAAHIALHALHNGCGGVLSQYDRAAHGDAIAAVRIARRALAEVERLRREAAP